MKKILLFIFMLILFSSCSNKNKKITIVLDWYPNTNHTGLFVAKDKGYFQDLDLDVEIVQPPEGSTTQLIGTGSSQIGISFQDTLAKYFASKDKLPVTVIATILQHNTSGLISLKEKNITSFKNLEGKTYGTWDDPIEQAIIKKLMYDENASWDKVNIIPYSWDVIKALKTDTDAAWIYYGWDGIALELQGLKTNYLEAKTSPELDYYTPVIIANNDYLKDNKNEVKKLMKAISKGYEFASNNPNEAAQILLNNAPELDKNLVYASQKWISKQYIADASKFGIIDEKRWNNFYHWLYKNKVIDQEIPDNFGFTNEYIGD